MRIRYATLVALVALSTITTAQTQSPYTHPGKVLVRSAATDALYVTGGIVASQVQAATLTATTLLGLTNNDPVLMITEPDGPTDAKRWRFISSAGNLLLQAQNDAGSVNTNGWQFIQTGGTPTQVRNGADGTVSVPAYSFVSDPDTGMYRAAAGELGLASDGVLVSLVRKFAGGNGNNLTLPNAAVGTGANSGGYLSIGANTSGNGAPGWLDLVAKNSTHYGVWADSTGVLRIGSSGPTEAAGDTGGTVVGTQTSSRASKHILSQVNTLAPSAMALIRHTPVYAFTYKNGAYNGETFYGITTDDSPFFGMDGGKSFNPVTAFGTTVLALQDTDRRVRELEAKLAAALAAIETLQKGARR